MKKISLSFGLGLLGIILMAFIGNHKCEKSESDELVALFSEEIDSFEEILSSQNETEILKIEDIVDIENGEIELVFHTAEYLPVGFNAYEGMELDFENMGYIELDELMDMDFSAEDLMYEELVN